MATRLAALCLLLPVAAAAADRAMGGLDDAMVELRRFAAVELQAPDAPRLTLIAATAKKPKKPRFDYDFAKLRAMYESLRGQLKTAEYHVLQNFPVTDRAGGGLSFPVFALYGEGSGHKLAVFYLLETHEIPLMTAPGQRPPAQKMIAFTIEGLRYHYLAQHQPDLAPAYEDEKGDGKLTKDEIVTMPGTPFVAQDAIAVVSREFLITRTR